MATAKKPMATPASLLEVEGLHAWYGESHILHGVGLEIAPGEVELRWQPESWGAASWAALGIAVLGLSFPVLAYAPFLLPLVPLGFWMLKRRIHRAKTLRLTPHYLVVGDSRWSRDELSEIAVDQSSQPTGRERGLRRALRDEQARTSHRVVLYRGSKPIVVARDLEIVYPGRLRQERLHRGGRRELRDPAG